MAQNFSPHKLERFSFLFSEARLLIAALALFIGGVPPLLAYNPSPSLYSPLSSILTLAWILSGIASAYLFYRWYSGNKTIFGSKRTLDTAAFFVSIVSGINLGLTGILKNNIGMSISSNQTVFVIVGILYIASAGYLYKRWLEHGKKLF